MICRVGPLLPEWQLRIVGNNVDGWRWSLERVLLRRTRDGEIAPPPRWMSEKAMQPMQTIRGPKLCPTEHIAVREALLVWQAEVTREESAASYVIPLPLHPTDIGEDWADRISTKLVQHSNSSQERNGNGPRIVVEPPS